MDSTELENALDAGLAPTTKITTEPEKPTHEGATVQELRQYPWLSFIVKPNSKARALADITYSLHVSYMRAGVISERIYQFFALSDRYQQASLVFNMTALDKALAEHCLAAEGFEDFRIREIKTRKRSFKSVGDDHTIQWPCEFDPNAFLRKLSNTHKEKLEAEQHLRNTHTTFFSSEFQHIMDKLVRLKNRHLFLATILAQCNSGTDEFFDHYPESSSMEYLFRRCADAGYPELHSIRVVKSDDYHKLENVREIEHQLEYSKEQYAQECALNNKAVERIQYLEGLLGKYSIPFNPAGG